MSTEVELQQHFFPLVQAQPPQAVPLWNAGYQVPRIIATAPAIDLAADDNGNFEVPRSPPGLTTRFLPGGMIDSHQEEQHCLANFLSSGNNSDLNITDSNIHYYLQVASVLNHKPLEKLCEDFLQNNENREWEIDRCFPKESPHSADKKNSNNNNYLNLNINGLNFPKFQILFLKQTDSEDHSKVLVLDLRRLNESQKILDVKKVARFEHGFACCTAYFKQCPYIFFSGRMGKKENALLKYDVLSHKWFHCPDIRYAHAKHIIAFSNNAVYIIGGKNCSAVEKYNINNNCCSLVGSLSVGVHSAAHAVFKNKIFLFGGKTLRGNVSAVQCIDTKTNTVTRLQDLPFQCSGGQAIVVGDVIYFATNHGRMVKFDPVSGLTTVCSQQPYHRKHFVMFENDCRVHLFGGVRTDGRIENETSMFSYNPLSNSWQKTLTFGVSLPVQTSCTVVYPKECPVKPFTKLFGYC